jgi:hypothetical protein
MHYRKLSLLLVVAFVGLVGIPAQAQTVSNCEPAIGQTFLDINNVRATIYNNGNLFWRGAANVYEVPKGSGLNTIFASGIWMGGQVAGQLRLAGSTYGPYEFWAGPLNDDGSPPVKCAPFDRVWRISKEDIVAYNGSGIATPDLQDWPTGLGAPTLDANGDPIDLTSQPLASRVDRKINLPAGERPAILGDQMAWWINNDRGNQHNRTDTPPMGVEVHGSAFAFFTSGALGNVTFYKYRIFYKGSTPLENTYMGLFSDPDLGAAFDDYVGSDTTLGLGYVYNADNDDDGNYGANAPASGYDFFQGPLVNTNGIDDNGDGQIDEDNERLKMTAFVFYNNGGGVQGDPGNGDDMYNYMQARWRDGQRITFGGDGRNFSNIPTSFMYPGNPPEFWSEFDSDGSGTAIAPADRRFVMATGPFTINPGEEQTLVYGIVTSFGGDNLASVQKMKSDDALAQQVFDIDFALPSPPAGPRVTTTVDDGSVLLEWGYISSDNNFLDGYSVIDPLLSSDVTDNDYVFEGYNVYQFEDAGDQEGELLKVYDAVNGIKRVIEGAGLTFITADGNDNGIAHAHLVDGLTNYKTYFFGVQAYAYNATSGQRVYAGPITKVKVQPTKTDKIVSEDAVKAASTAGFDLESTKGDGNVGNGNVTVNVINPAKITGHAYKLEFQSVDLDPGSIPALRERLEGEYRVDDRMQVEAAKGAGAASVIVYNISDTDAGTVVFDGAAAAQVTGKPTPERDDVISFDGLSVNVSGAPDDWLNMAVTANAAGPLVPPGGAVADYRGFPGARPSDRQQVGDGQWFFATGDNGQSLTYDHFLARAMRNGFGNIVPFDFELRFTARGGLNYDRFFSGSIIVGQDVPFEIWNTGIATPDDPSDDYRLIPAIIDWDDDGFNLQNFDSSISSASNDPESDWIYWYKPIDTTPGESGYDTWAAAALGGDVTGQIAAQLISRSVVVNWNGGDVTAVPPVYNQDMPEEGTIFRLESTKPNQPGDNFSFSSAGLGARDMSPAEATAAVKEIGIVPNPYKGASAYEVSQLTDQVRFTNMPNQATIRVFTLNGTLIRTLIKNSPERTFAWDLTTEEELPIASGMYIIHVQTDLGDQVLKFGVIKKRIQLNAF